MFDFCAIERCVFWWKKLNFASEIRSGVAKNVRICSGVCFELVEV